MRGKSFRETTEWFQCSISNATCTGKPRILLTGDSITVRYYPVVSKLLQGAAHCAYFSTSAAIADPVYLKQIAPLFEGYEYRVIHFNNGLHGFDCTEDEYRAGYEKTLEFIRKKAPAAKLILALSTPLQAGSRDARLNPRVDARNRIVRELAGTFSLEINNLYSLTKNRPELHSDPYHHNEQGVSLQAKQVADKIRSLLVR